MKKMSFEKAVDKVYKKFASLDEQSIASILEKNKDGDYARIFYATRNIPYIQDNFGIFAPYPLEYDVVHTTKNYVTNSFTVGEFFVSSAKHKTYVIGRSPYAIGTLRRKHYIYNVKPQEYLWAMAA